jgi:hypothetical protein
MFSSSATPTWFFPPQNQLGLSVEYGNQAFLSNSRPASLQQATPPQKPDSPMFIKLQDHSAWSQRMNRMHLQETCTSQWVSPLKVYLDDDKKAWLESTPSTASTRSDSYDEVETQSSEGEDAQLGRVLMLQNIPCRVSDDMVLDLITKLGFGDECNLLHVPSREMKKKNKKNGSMTRSNRGYAFVGFKTEEVAAQFAEQIRGYRFPECINSNKAIEVAPARNQDMETTHMNSIQTLR